MSWKVRVPRRVSKSLKRLPSSDRKHIIEILREFEIDPWYGDIVKLSGKKDSWRRRVGNYRIFYSVEIKQRVVEIKEVKRRTSDTY